jgi:GNAT superfamily N-acetyltransferase
MTPSPGNMDKVEVRVSTLEEILPVRHAILRPGRPLETARYANDNDSGVRHFGAYRGGKLLSVVSVYPADMPDRPGIAAIQLRGMATRPEARGTGLGSILVAAALDFTREQGARILWCNARSAAVEFYRKLGFEIVSDEFEIPNIGPHFVMKVNLPVAAD